MFVYCYVSPVDVATSDSRGPFSLLFMSGGFPPFAVSDCKCMQLDSPPSPSCRQCVGVDPVLSEDELQVVESFGCLRIPVNEAYRCAAAMYHPTLFFMLHCGVAMYSNLLGAIWGREGLRHVALLGNPLSSYYLG